MDPSNRLLLFLSESAKNSRIGPAYFRRSDYESIGLTRKDDVKEWLDEQAAVAETRERVVVGQVADLLLAALAFGDVLGRSR